MVYERNYPKNPGTWKPWRRLPRAVIYRMEIEACRRRDVGTHEQETKDSIFIYKQQTGDDKKSNLVINN